MNNIILILIIILVGVGLAFIFSWLTTGNITNPFLRNNKCNNTSTQENNSSCGNFIKTYKEPDKVISNSKLIKEGKCESVPIINIEAQCDKIEKTTDNLIVVTDKKEKKDCN